MIEGKNSIVLPIVGGIIALSVIFSVMLLWSGKLNDNDTSAKGHPNLGDDFTLQSAAGPVSLSDYRGKVVVLYFGYAFCPDVCPTSLGLLSLAFNKLSQDELNDVQAFFISVDPERDTVEKLEKYVGVFHPSIMGITGTPEEIAEVARIYGAIYMKVELPGSALGYSVDHSSRYYLIDREGVARELIPHGTSPEDIVVSLREVLNIQE